MRQVLAVFSLLLVLAGTRATAAPVTVLSKADPASPSGSAGGQSTVMGISADGRYVLFTSVAANLVAGVQDDNDDTDVFLHDSVTGTTVLVSHAADDPFTAGDFASLLAVLSADGRYVAFQSGARNLVAGQTGQTDNVFLYDRVTGAITLVSHAPGLATSAVGGAWDRLEISADGGRVLYDSIASDLIAGQIDSSFFSVDLFLYDRAAGTNTLVSHTSASPTTAAGGVEDVAISADGSRVAFVSDATNLVAGQIDANGDNDAFLYDAATGAVSLVSHAAGSAVTTANGGTLDVKISLDGAWVGILSAGTNLVAGQSDANGNFDVFLHERASGTNTLVSRVPGSLAIAANGKSWWLSLSGDGRYVAFQNDSSNLASNDVPRTNDVFLFDCVAATTTLVSRSSSGTPAGHSQTPEVSADGAWVVFASMASDLVVGQTGSHSRKGIFLWQRATNTMTMVSHADGSSTSEANGESMEAFRLSANAGRIAMTSRASDIVSDVNDANTYADVFLFDRASGSRTLLSIRGGAVSETAGTASGYPFAPPPGLSNDGRYTVFTSPAPNLIPGLVDENNSTDVFLHDRLAGTLTLVSRSHDDASRAGDLPSYNPVMSADGSTVLFLSLAGDLVPGQVTTSPFGYLFVYDRASGAVSLVDHAASSPARTADAPPWDFADYALSGDGRWIAFASAGNDLVAGQTDVNGKGDIFLHDRTTGQNTLVSHAASFPARTADNTSSNPILSGDGRYIVFQSTATDLIEPGGTGGLFLHDRVAGTTVKVSPSGYGINLSGDGRWLLFASDAADLVPGQVDANRSADLFLWDRVAGSTVLVSHAASSPTAAGATGAGPRPMERGRSLLSVDGRWVVFSSRAADLVSGVTDVNSGHDVFLYDRVAGTVSLVSWSTLGTATGLESSMEPAISADGRWIAFRSQAPDLVPGQIETGSSFDEDFFLHDRTSGTTSLVSHTPGSELTAAGAPYISLELARPSADGAWVTFATPGPDLTAGDLNGRTDAFLHANPLPGRDFFTVTPCRVLASQPLTSGIERAVEVAGACGIPATARAIAVNVTVVQPSDRGRLTLHPGDLAAPLTSTINFAAGETRANNALLALALDGTGTLSLTPFVIGDGTVHAILDVSGYFE